jgi:hypothetical protein
MGMDGTRALTAAVALWALLLVAWFAAYPTLVNHDAAMYVHAGQLLLDGQTPYVDFLEPNPPLVMYLSAFPAALAPVLGMSPPLSLQLCTLAAILASVAAFITVAARARLTDDSIDRGDLALAALGLLAVHLGVTVTVDQGQREHLFALGWVPFAAVRWARHVGAPPGLATALSLGFIAGLFASLKPHFFAPVLAAEAALALHARRRPRLDPEIAAFLSAPAMYAAHFLLIPSEMREAFFGRIVPMMRHGYDAFGFLPWSELLKPTILGALAASVALAVTVRGKQGPRSALLALAGGFTAGTIVPWLLQGRWTYHAIPLWTGISMTSALLLAELRRLKAARRAVSWAVTTLVLVTSIQLVAGGIMPPLWRADPLTVRLAELTRPGDSVAVFAAEVNLPYPRLLELGLRPGSRYLWLFPPAMLRYGLAEALPRTPEEDQLLEELAVDLRVRKPALVLVRVAEHPFPPRDLWAYLRGYPALAEELDKYEVVDEIHLVQILRRR